MSPEFKVSGGSPRSCSRADYDEVSARGLRDDHEDSLPLFSQVFHLIGSLETPQQHPEPHRTFVPA